MTHTALGERWVYDGCTDPVYVTALATAILTGGVEAELFLSTDSGLVAEPSETHVRGSGSPPAQAPDLGQFVVTNHGRTTRMHGSVSLTLLRVPTTVAGTATLTGTWPGQNTPLLVATIS